MGVQSYQCFVQHNRQNIDSVNECMQYMQLIGLEECIVVKIPMTISVEKIKSMKLSDFEQYDIIEGQYNWNGRFENIGGFAEAEDLCIWRSSEPYLAQYWLVNFEPFAYSAFVQEEHDPSDIPIEFYNIIFANHKKNMLSMFPTLDRTEIYKYIRENKWDDRPIIPILKPSIVYLNKNERYLILPNHKNPYKLDDITVFKAKDYMIEPFENDYYDIRVMNVNMHSHRRIDKDGMIPISEYVAIEGTYLNIYFDEEAYGFKSQDIFSGINLEEEETVYNDYKEIRRVCTHKAIVFSEKLSHI